MDQVPAPLPVERASGRVLFSDSSKSFLRAGADMQHLFNPSLEPELRELLAERRIEWISHCVQALWGNSIAKRLIRGVEGSLPETLGDSLICVWELQTILVELSAVIYGRPLSYSFQGNLERSHRLSSSVAGHRRNH